MEVLADILGKGACESDQNSSPSKNSQVRRKKEGQKRLEIKRFLRCCWLDMGEPGDNFP